MRTELYKSANADDKKPVVLVVDDEETVLETLSLQLGREYRVLTAPDGDRALQVLSEQGAPAAVISDMRMPGMNGIELLRRVQMEYPCSGSSNCPTRRPSSGPVGSAPWSASSATSCRWTACGRSRWPRWPPSSARSPCPPPRCRRWNAGCR
ncbi:hypothetical protein Apa02nite_058520 [Actinoplanes palleronii]|uniref:Response regulatory domain-containing protein n=1 Tax=Actinoplanes palleronii TaxID=113570 RepID=A0ABQ4BGG2_9ACTN|nr:response regulator [Actinoplanes palleronii]GIE69744.1 hypothetical protein Apa02nite_058520 [Actinoplanes palleronii]